VYNTEKPNVNNGQNACRTQQQLQSMMPETENKTGTNAKK